VPYAMTFVVAWLVLCGALWLLLGRRQRPPLVELPAWSTPDTRTLVLLLLVVPAVFVFPYKNLGARDADGNRFYRAYFTADFIWHMALTAELTKYSMPPINPYVGDRTIQYYWTYFLVPAVISEEGVGGLREIENSLKVNALCSGVLFIASLVIATWAVSLSAVGTALAVVVAVVAASAEGLYAWGELVWQGRPASELTGLNIDAMSNWRFKGLRVDSLVRSMWYNPQHSMSAAFGLLAMPIAALAMKMVLRKESERLTTTDSLTSLYNRRHFDRSLEAEVGKAKRYGHKVSVVTLDVDQPREGSSRAGRPGGVGDQVLSDMARLLKRSTRGTDCIARYGYDEFRILLPHTDGDRAKVAAERFRSVVEKHTFARRKKPTIHIDIATYPVDERANVADDVEVLGPEPREVAVN